MNEKQLCEDRENLAVDEYIQLPISKKLYTIYTDEESPLFDEKYAPKNQIADEIERISTKEKPLFSRLFSSFYTGKNVDCMLKYVLHGSLVSLLA